MRFKLREISIFQTALLSNCSILLIWWIIFNPGFFSADSFSVIEMARSGNLNSEWTSMWSFSVYLLTMHGTHPEVATLFFSLLLAFSVSLFAATVLPPKYAVLSSSLICVTPTVGAMGITLWHDIPMTCGFLFITSGFAKHTKGQSGSLLCVLFGGLLSSFRYNGLPTIIIFLILLLFLGKNRRFVIITLSISIGFLGLTTVSNSESRSQNSVQVDGLTDWMRYDISCYAAKSEDTLFFEQSFKGTATLLDWRSESACSWFGNSIIANNRTSVASKYILSAWVTLAKKNPEFILKTHFKRHAYLSPLPLFGLPRVPFLNTIIEFPNKGIKFTNPKLANMFRYFPRSWNYFNYIFGYSGLWLFLILFFAWKKKNIIYFQIGILGLLLSAGLFVFAEIADGRYVLFILITGQLFLVQELLEGMSKFKTRKNNLPTVGSPPEAIPNCDPNSNANGLHNNHFS
jgi:hypothetical protein